MQNISESTQSKNYTLTMVNNGVPQTLCTPEILICNDFFRGNQF